jgi:hypothetical protein
MTRIRHIRIYRCEKDAIVIHDHGEVGSKFLDTILCPKCKRPMGHTTATYQITTPDPTGRPQLRIARKLEAA